MPHPPKILVYTSPARGHLYPIVDTALALVRRGSGASSARLVYAKPSQPRARAPKACAA